MVRCARIIVRPHVRGFTYVRCNIVRNAPTPVRGLGCVGSSLRSVLD